MELSILQTSLPLIATPGLQGTVIACLTRAQRDQTACGRMHSNGWQNPRWAVAPLRLSPITNHDSLLKRKPASYPLGLSLFFKLTGQYLKTIDNVQLPLNIYMIGVGTPSCFSGEKHSTSYQGLIELTGNCLSGSSHSDSYLV